MKPAVLIPDWPAPKTVCAVSTLRHGGVSAGPFASLNLGTHVGDDAQRVCENRRRFAALLPAAPMWLDQVHGIDVAPHRTSAVAVRADAAFSSAAGAVCAVMTADCLPVLFCDASGSVVAAAHAGWRGLLAGVLENTIRAMQVPPNQLLAWFGPAIGARAFEVGDEVRDAFVARDDGADACFAQAQSPGKWWADLVGLARLRLTAAGVHRIHGGRWCTFEEPERFFSYRRDGRCGRHATAIWLSASVHPGDGMRA
ncbi:MAG: peptidoglycan editing factor PgeF [Rhodocyclaceae bacterium]|nr:peptidoglycan editing factor PgeF [Rhodocyclaceae bacterium]